MFDWARGSMLKKLIQLNLFRANWDRGVAELKNWHTPWLLGLLEFTPGLRVLDIGSATPSFMQYLQQQFRCDVHALDAAPGVSSNDRWGFPADVAEKFPEVKLHFGLAGEELLPPEEFDLITCISTLEHIYDNESPLVAHRPLPHLHALRDMVRMLKPGGLFLMNWDIYLDTMPHHIGWDFEIDYQILKAAGMQLVSERRRVRSATWLFNHTDTLFVEPSTVLHFKLGQLRRGTAINVLWKKPGNVSQIRFSPHPELEACYFPLDESLSEEPNRAAATVPTTDEIDQRFRRLISRVTDVMCEENR